jgi:hypothetical protein
VVFDTTTVDDTALYTVEAALDRTLPSGKMSVAGDEITVQRVADLAGEVFGGAFEMRRKGLVVELEHWIAATKANDSNFWAPIAAQYQWAMVSGKAKLTELADRRYPQLKPTSFGAFLKANVKATVFAWSAGSYRMGSSEGFRDSESCGDRHEPRTFFSPIPGTR